jgi:serine/threonine protein kinase
LDIIEVEKPSNQGALKVLHDSSQTRDLRVAGERITREIRAMKKATHPNLLRILHSDVEKRWFVSEFHPNGVLQDQLDKFRGNFPAALRAFRPLVAAVAELHAKKIVHRDIKPANVFLSSSNDLILGDMGLAFFENDQHARVSATFENVGTRDWMPGWAMGHRIDKVGPSFDVFGLGKLLWAMTSGKPFLPLWYFHKKQYNVESLHCGTPYIHFANDIFSRCIVEDERDCLTDAHELLKEVDRVLLIMNLGADKVSDNIERHCAVCGEGTYELSVDCNRDGMRKFGIEPTEHPPLRIFACTSCGHVQMFSCLEQKDSPSRERPFL